MNSFDKYEKNYFKILIYVNVNIDDKKNFRKIIAMIPYRVKRKNCRPKENNTTA